ncbi:MAG: hypothetical protein V4519_03915 [Patescibacteria group bacterium]
MFKSSIIESSLTDKSFLDSVNILNTRRAGSWILHDVLIEKEQIELISKSLVEGPWYVHAWEEGKDDVCVIYKNKIFWIKYSDKSTWSDAVEYGKSIGIPEEQLDFPIS